MLNWWLGRTADGSRVEDKSPDHELPETPAPVFAARALKSAIFGTPAPPSDDDNVFEEDRKSRVPLRKGSIEYQSRNLSPTKPPGILLTPGTATTRRKTVSFGNEILEKGQEREDGDVTDAGLNGKSNPSQETSPSTWDTEVEASVKLTRKTTLTRTLENARAGRTAKSEKTPNSSEAQPQSKALNSVPGTKLFPSEIGPSKAGRLQQSNQNLLRQVVEIDDLSGEITMDLNQPHSQSGRFWKSEYEQYHEQAQAEMKKLIGYKQLAKSYAKMKDAENVDLSEKLKEYQQALINMEDQISQLSAQIALSGTEGREDDSPELVKELARQTALSIQYKTQVAEFEAALEGSDVQNLPINSVDPERKRRASHRSGEIDINTSHGSRKARQQLKEVSLLKEELKTLRQSFSAAEKSTSKLQEENTKLTQELLHADMRLQKHLEKCEKKRQSLDEQRYKQDEMFQSLQNDYDRLKEQAKSQRRDAEHLLKKRHDQVVELKKEIAYLRGAGSNAQELQQTLQERTIQHDLIVAQYQAQIQDMKEKRKQDLKATISSKDLHDRNYETSCRASRPVQSIGTPVRESLIPVSNQTISKPSKVLMQSKNTHSETPAGSPKHRSSHSALSEFVNVGKNQPTPFQRSGPVQHTPQIKSIPQTNQFSNMSLDSPHLPLLSEPSLPRVSSRAIHERSCHLSSQTSMFNIASSPPKAAVVRPRVSRELSRQKSNSNIISSQNETTAASHPISSERSRVKGSIPPERAAAAKARLERKQAEKRRAQASEVNKENLPT
ncbi:urease accessory protein [Diplocarpon rosae]|nr:urease accessory protein [Diplocarpon rosae]